MALRRFLSAGLRPAFTRGIGSHTMIDHSKLFVQRTTHPKVRVPKEKLSFGAVTTDHMLEVDWTHRDGWSPPRIVPYAPLSIDPTASCLHYGIEAFEGMKAYASEKVGAGGVPEVHLFRPNLNMARLNTSMVRLALPPLDKVGFLECIKSFVDFERSWIPTGEGYSLYLRPTIIGTWPYLGVSAAKSAKLFCIACPVGPYYAGGFKPISLLADSVNSRAWPGGVGHCKVGGNYAPAILPQLEAAKMGHNSVLWLVGSKRNVSEVGTMNFFVVWKTRDGSIELVTPPLDGTILPGVTRTSILELARSWKDMRVSEREFTMHDIEQAAAEGRLLEAFGSGTAAVVAPVHKIHFEGNDIKVPVDAVKGAGPVAKRVWDALADISYGRLDHQWAVKVPQVFAPEQVDPEL